MEKQEKTKNLALQVFRCQPKQLKAFNKSDPFNPSNLVTGYLNHKEGKLGGSIYITKVNNQDVTPQIIYGTPKLLYPYKDFENYEFKIPKSEEFFISTKWNGMNVLIYKYKDQNGKTFISAKSKGTPFLQDGIHGNFFTYTKKALGIPMDEALSVSIPLLKDLSDPDIQSKTFELCGKQEPHLVKYDFEIRLQPLFVTTVNGDIKPYVGNISDFGPVKGWSQEKIAEKCQEFQRIDFQTNEEYRKQRGLSLRYEYEHFATEGRVLYCLNEAGVVLKRTLYKIKPKDIEEVHWSSFDKTMEGRVKEVLKKIQQRDKPISEKSLREELDMGPKEWSRFSTDTLKCALATLESETLNVFDHDARRVVLLSGIGGSGKTFFAKELEKLGWTIMDSNQTMVKLKLLLLSGPKIKVVLDNYFLNPKQRKNILEVIKDYKVPTLEAVYFKVELGLCKERLEREGRVMDMVEVQYKNFKPPSLTEGFLNVYGVGDDEEFVSVLSKFK